MNGKGILFCPKLKYYYIGHFDNVENEYGTFIYFEKNIIATG